MNRFLVPLALIVFAVLAVATISQAQPIQPDVYEVKVTSGKGRAFQPQDVTIPAGTLVRWVQAGGGQDSPHHTIISTDSHEELPHAPNGMFRGALPNPGDVFEYRFAEAGTFPYYCENHASLGMIGQIIVSGGELEDSPLSVWLALVALGAALLVHRRR